VRIAPGASTENRGGNSKTINAETIGGRLMSLATREEAQEK
jgi:hypothetical protein